MNKLLILCLSILFVMGSRTSANGQCFPDLLPPAMACAAGLEVTLEANQMVTVEATDLNGGCTDNCTASADLLFRIEAGIGSQNPPLTSSITFDAQDVGLQIVTLWAIDEAGNDGLCWTEILVLGDCQGNNPLPVCIDQLEIEVAAGESVSLSPNDILEGAGYCYTDFTLQLDPPSIPFDTLVITSDDYGLHIIQVTNILTLDACWGTLTILPDCTTDLIPPVAACDQDIVLPLSQDGPDLTILTAVKVNEGSSDNCSASGDLSFSLELAAMPSPVMPLTAQLEFTAEGTYGPIILWVADEAGNVDICLTEVEIIPPSCFPDLTPPTCTAPGDTAIAASVLSTLGVNLNDFVQLDLLFGAAASFDYCGPSVIVPSVDVHLDSCNRPVEVIRSFFSTDLALNISDTVYQSIEIVHGLEVVVPGDAGPGIPQPDSLFIVINGNLFTATYIDSLIDLTCDDTTDLIIRTWLVDDPCTDTEEDVRIELPRLDLNNDGEDGDSYLTLPLLDSLYLVQNGIPTVALGPISGKYSYVQTIVINETDSLMLSASGQVFIDTLENCSLDPGEPLLAGWPVKAVGLITGTVYTDTTEADGTYHFEDICPLDLVLEISLNVPLAYGSGCQTTWEVPCSQNDPGEQNIPVQLNADCPIVEVDLSAPKLRRCDANVYTVSYTNYSAEIIPDASLEIMLDSYLELTGSSLAATALGNNTFAIDLGDLEPGYYGQVTLNCNVSCEAPLGYTHCSEVHFYPDTLCPQSPEWSGANIEVSGFCDQDSIYLQIRNSGQGNMAGPLEYTIVEDVIMFMQDEFQLNSGATLDLDPIPANGNTWRLEAEQEPGHPFPGDVAVSIRDCAVNGNDNGNMFAVENPNPFIAIDCQPNVSSFDPNAKSALPSGYGPSHYIEQNTQIEYLLQFQNTGTDTANTVILLDTLSGLLGAQSIRTGTASHPYQFELLQGHIIRFTFDPIVLPPAGVDEAQSNGYVKFSIDQQANLSIGSVIENRAAIYFDKNDPIITNTVIHTIGNDFIEVISDVQDPVIPGSGTLHFYPNPAVDHVTFQLDGSTPGPKTFRLFDHRGRVIQSQVLAANAYRLDRGNLPAGWYAFVIYSNGVEIHSGKIILH